MRVVQEGYRAEQRAAIAVCDTVLDSAPKNAAAHALRYLAGDLDFPTLLESATSQSLPAGHPAPERWWRAL